MEYVNLGRAGIKVSRICLGMGAFGSRTEWGVEVQAARKIVKCAFDLGVNFVDTGPNYPDGRTEVATGALLVGHRRDIILATKVFFPVGDDANNEGLSRYRLLREIDRSLKRLRTDHVDLYQIHRWDYSTPIEETLRTLEDIIRMGKATYIGASSMYAWQFAKALFLCDLIGTTRFVSMQNHYNLAYREEEREMIPLCRDQGIGVMAWSPLARGFLTGKYARESKPSGARYRGDKHLGERYFRPEDFGVVERASEIAREKGVKTSQVALAWLLSKGVTAAVLGATRIEHVQDAAEALSLKLSVDDLRRLEEPYKTHPISGHQ